MEEQNTMNKTPEELIDENRPQFIGDLIETESNTKIEVIAMVSLCKMVYSAVTSIFMKYDDHKDMYPSLKDITISDFDIFCNEPYIKLNAYEKEFIIKITKMPEEYEKILDVNEKERPRVKFNIEDNMVVSSISFASTGDTVCEITPILIPYGFIDMAMNVMQVANEEDYSDLHDTILGFNTMMNLTCGGETHCNEKDVFCFEDGFDIAYKKALVQKILLDIDNMKTTLKVYNDKLNEYNRRIVEVQRTIRRLKKSKSRLHQFITNK